METLKYSQSLTNATGSVISSITDTLINSNELRREEVVLTNETYALDLSKYANINFLNVLAYYDENSTTPSIVAQGDPAPFQISINGNTFDYKESHTLFPNVAITSISIITSETRKIKFKVVISTSA
jgi:hypothetical protein